jgi:hypothetical protein
LLSDILPGNALNDTGIYFFQTFLDFLLPRKLNIFVEGLKDKAVEMARKMKENREPLEKIILYTGLSAEEIQEL